MVSLVDIGLFSVIAVASNFLILFFMFKMLGKNIAVEFGGFLTNFKEMMIEPQTKRAFSHIGKMGADRKSVDNLKDKMAMDVIQSQYGKYIPLIEMTLGVDVNEYLEEHGAANILKAISELAPELGFDLEKGLKNLNITQNISEYGKRRW